MRKTGILQKLFGKEKRAAEVITADENIMSALRGIEITEDKAMEIPAVSACVDFISDVVAMLPIKLYCDGLDGNTKEITDDDRLGLLNDETGDLLDPFQMKKAVARDFLLFGSGYIYPEMHRNEFVSLRYVDRKNVMKINKNIDPVFKSAEFVLSNGMRLRDDELIKVLRDTRDGMSGVGIVMQHQQLLSAMYKEIVYEKFLVSTGGNKKGFLVSENKLEQEQLDYLKEKWQELYANTGAAMMILNKGLSFHESSNTSVEMQLNENKVRNNELACQIFGLSPYAASGKTTADEFVSSIRRAAIPVISAYEAALNKGMLLPSERKKYYYAFDTSELLKGDILKRYQAYKIALESNIMQIDEARYREDLPPLGLNWIKLGLQDVLYDPKTKTIYTPNMNQSMTMSENKLPTAADKTVDNNKNSVIMEERQNDGSHYTKDEHGRFTGSTSTGGGSGGSSSGGGSGTGGKKSGKAPKMSKKERSKVSHGIATDFPKLESDGIKRKYEYGNYSYDFYVNDFGSYRFVSKRKIN